MTDAIHRRELKIAWGDCDPAGIVFYPRFLEMFDWSTWLLMANLSGVPIESLRKTLDIEGFPLVDVKARFLLPCYAGSTAVIESGAHGVSRSSFHVAHRLFLGDQVAVTCDEVRVWAVRTKDDPPKLASRPIPDHIRGKMASDKDTLKWESA